MCWPSADTTSAPMPRSRSWAAASASDACWPMVATSEPLTSGSIARSSALTPFAACGPPLDHAQRWATASTPVTHEVSSEPSGEPDRHAERCRAIGGRIKRGAGVPIDTPDGPFRTRDGASADVTGGAITATSLSFAIGMVFPDGTHAIDEVTFAGRGRRVRDGRRARPGCGKSTLLRIASGPARADRRHGRRSTASTSATCSRTPRCCRGAPCARTSSCWPSCAASTDGRAAAARPGRHRPRRPRRASRTTTRSRCRAACGCAARWPAR